MLDLRSTEDVVFGDSPAAVALPAARDVVVIAGPGAAEYLHGQLSQDVLGLAVGDSAPSLLLQPQGKVDAWGRLSRIGEDVFWFDVDPGHGEAVVARLERFKLRVEATITSSGGALVALRGSGAAAGPAALGINVGSGVAALAPSWPGISGFDLVAPDAADLPTLPATIEEGAPAALEVERLVLGIPTMGRELTEGTIPAAAGVVDASVDFTKGCYVGQELVARIDSRSAGPPQRLQGVRFSDGAPPAVGTELVGAGGAVIATVTASAESSRFGPIGLAYVKRGTELPATVTAVGHDGATVGAELLELPLPAAR